MAPACVDCRPRPTRLQILRPVLELLHICLALLQGKYAEAQALDEAELPAALKPMAPAEQRAYVVGLAGERADLRRQIEELAEDRDDFLKKKVEEAGGYKDSLDQKIYDAVAEQGEEAGLEYSDGPEY